MHAVYKRRGSRTSMGAHRGTWPCRSGSVRPHWREEGNSSVSGTSDATQSSLYRVVVVVVVV